MFGKLWFIANNRVPAHHHHRHHQTRFGLSDSLSELDFDVIGRHEGVVALSLRQLYVDTADQSHTIDLDVEYFAILVVRNGRQLPIGFVLRQTGHARLRGHGEQPSVVDRVLIVRTSRPVHGPVHTKVKGALGDTQLHMRRVRQDAYRAAVFSFWQLDC